MIWIEFLYLNHFCGGSLIGIQKWIEIGIFIRAFLTLFFSNYFLFQFDESNQSLTAQEPFDQMDHDQLQPVSELPTYNTQDSLIDINPPAPANVRSFFFDFEMLISR